ncbi:MAG: type II toxin-antitoxin system HicB family antitoxin [Methanosarcinales archaeon]
MKIKVILEPDLECGGYVIYSQLFPGCVSQGETKEEAINNFLDALDGWLEVKAEIESKIVSTNSEIIEVTA